MYRFLVWRFAVNWYWDPYFWFWDRKRGGNGWFVNLGPLWFYWARR